MAHYLDICKICLRTNVVIKEIDNVLANYFSILTKFRLSNIDSRLCSECTHLLKKSYNFSKKCEKSSEILQNWIDQDVFEENVGVSKIPLNSLHLKIPQTSLKVTTQENLGEEYNFSFQEETGICSDLYNVSNAEQNSDHFIKQEINSSNSEVLKDLFQVEAKDTTNSFHEVLLQNDLNTTENDTDMINEYNADFSLNDDQPNESDDDIKYDTDIKNDETNDKSEIKDDLSSDDECLAELIRKKTLKHDLDKNDTTENMSQDNLSQEEMSNKCQSKQKFDSHLKRLDKQVENSSNKVVKKLNLMNKELSKIYKDWEEICLTELPSTPLSKSEVSKMRVSNNNKMSTDNNKSAKGGSKVENKLEILSSDLDVIKNKCHKLIDYKQGLLDPKESLRIKLKSKFASCGELKTADGFVINKETILNCFDRLSERLMKRLWRFMQGDASIDPRAINTLKHIQNKYQNEFLYDSVFHIEYLNTQEKLAEEFEKRKTYQCYLDAKYKCEICYLGFRREAQMEYHKQIHEESAGQFVCPVCSIRQKQKRTLENHMRCHEAVYRCRLCPLVTYFRYSAKNHYNQHKGLEYSCEKCGITFKSKSAQKTHEWSRHTAGEHGCPNCGRAFATQRALDGHVQRCQKRTGAASVACPDCDMKFTSKHAYLRHAQTMHNTTCNTSQTNKDGTQRKKPIHKCRVCGAQGHSVGWLSLHFRESHPTVDMAAVYSDRGHLCELCGKTYSNMYSLREHLSIHADVRAHACEQCGARFHRAVSLAQHAQTHAPPRRACRVCRKRFRSLSNLNNHMRGHIGDRRYKCNLCGKGFLHRNALNEHIRGVHYKQRRARRKVTDPRANTNLTFDTSTTHMTLGAVS